MVCAQHLIYFFLYLSHVAVLIIHFACGYYVISIFIDIIKGFEQMLCALFLGIERLDVFIRTVEMQAANRLTIVVVKQDAEIGNCIPINYSTDVIHFGVENRPNDIESLQLLLGGHDPVVFRFICGFRDGLRLGFGLGLIFHHRVDRNGRLEAFVHVIVRILRECLLYNGPELAHYDIVETARVDRPGKVLDKFVTRFVDLFDDGIADFICVLELAGRIEDRIHVEITLVELAERLPGTPGIFPC